MNTITQQLADALCDAILCVDPDQNPETFKCAREALAAYDVAQSNKGTVKSNREWCEECALLRDALGRLTGALRLRYLAGGPQGSFFTNDLQLARDLVNLYDKDDDWTITDLENPYGPSDNGS